MNNKKQGHKSHASASDRTQVRQGKSVHLPPEIHRRLKIHAIARDMEINVCLAEVLDRVLPPLPEVV